MGYLESTASWVLGLIRERELWIAVLATVVVAIGSIAIKFSATRWRSRVGVRIAVKRIRRRGDSDLQAFLDIYENRIHADYRVENDDIIAWVATPAAHVVRRRDDLTLIAKSGDAGVAILKAIWGKSERLGFVAYLATRPKDESSPLAPRHLEREGIAALTAWVVRFLHRRKCRALVFEVPATEGDAMAGRFREYATLHGRRCCTLPIRYLQPNMELEPDRSEQPMVLVYVDLSRSGTRKSLSLPEVVAILDFIYFNVYYQTFRLRHSIEESSTYRVYLEELLAKQVKLVPGRVDLCAL